MRERTRDTRKLYHGATTVTYRNEPLQHLDDNGVAQAQVVAPPDFPGDANPPMNNVATSRYTTRCSYCLQLINVGTPFEVLFCDGCNEPNEMNDQNLGVDHTFVVGPCCNTELADPAANYIAVDEPLATDHPVFIRRAAR